MPSRIEAVKRRLSEREMPGAPRQRWYCSVSLRWKRRLGGGGATSGARAAGLRAGGAWAFPDMRPRRRTSFLWSTLPAAATTTLGIV
jgi:hypothetical protein